MTDLSHIREAHERGDLAETLRLSGAALAESTWTPRDRAKVLSYRAQTLWSLERFAEAAVTRQQEVEQLVAANSSAEWIATVRLGRAWALFRAKQFEQSLQEAAKVYLEREASLGAEHAKTLGGLQLCVYNLEALQRHEQTVPLALELYERRQAVFGADAPETIDARERLERAQAALATPSSPVAKRTVSATASASVEAAASPKKPLSRAVEVTAAIIGQTARLSVRGLVEAILD